MEHRVCLIICIFDWWPPRMMYPYRNHLLIILVVQNPQNSQEQVEDV